MVSILPSQRSGLDVLGSYLGQGASAAMPQMYENMKYQRGMSAIDQLQNALKPNAEGQIDIGQMLSNIARAVAANPGLERSGLVEHAMKQAQALNSQRVPLPNARDAKEMSAMPQRKEMPNFLYQPQQSQNFPTNIGPQNSTGNAPQEATTGQKTPIKSPQQMAKESPALAKEMTDAGKPTTVPEAYEILKGQNADAKLHNQEVDAERKSRVEAQKTYGAKGAEYLKKYYKNPSPELEAVFQKKGEQASLQGKSEAEINRFLAEEAKNLGNAITNVTTSPSAMRSYNKLGRAINGTYRNFDESAEDLRKNLQPLIKEGLYDFSRDLVAQQGYYPEEREIVVNPLSMAAQSKFNELPKMGSAKPGRMLGRPARDLMPLKQVLTEVKNVDPNFSLILGRKMAEDAGFGWSEYKNAINELMSEGFDLTDDQRNHIGELEEPPLNFLTDFLHDLGIRGR
jgi:hypothetical protein